MYKLIALLSLITLASGCSSSGRTALSIKAPINSVVGSTYRDGGSTWVEFYDSAGTLHGFYLDGYFAELGRSCICYIGKLHEGADLPGARPATREEITSAVMALNEYVAREYPKARLDALALANKAYISAMPRDGFVELSDVSSYDAIRAFITYAPSSGLTSH